jgi:hypothetical protein
VDERKPKVSYDLLADRLEGGSMALVITREHPEKVARDRDPGPAIYYWLSLKRTPRSLHPRQLRRIQRVAEDFLKRNPSGTVLLDGLEFIFQENGYARVLSFLDRLESIVSSRGGATIVPVDLRVFGVARASEMRERYGFVEPVESL